MCRSWLRGSMSPSCRRTARGWRRRAPRRCLEFDLAMGYGRVIAFNGDSPHLPARALMKRSISSSAPIWSSGQPRTVATTSSGPRPHTPGCSMRSRSEPRRRWRPCSGAPGLNLEVALTEPWYDIDDAADLDTADCRAAKRTPLRSPDGGLARCPAAVRAPVSHVAGTPRRGTARSTAAAASSASRWRGRSPRRPAHATLALRRLRRGQRGRVPRCGAPAADTTADRSAKRPGRVPGDGGPVAHPAPGVGARSLLRRLPPHWTGGFNASASIPTSSSPTIRPSP